MNKMDYPNFRAYVIYALAATFLFYEMALQASPSVMTHHLMKDLRIDAAELGIMASFYFYSYTFMQIPAGLMYDRFDARWLMSGALLICVLGALFFGQANSVDLAAAGRFLMGIGSAFAFISVLVVAARWFPSRYFALLVGIAQLLAAVGAMGGEVPLAAAVTAFGWRRTITWIALAGFIITLLIMLIVRNQPTRTQNTQAQKHENVVQSLHEVLVHSQTWYVALYAFCSWAPITAFAELWGVPYLMTVYGISNTLAASAVAMSWMGLGIASPLLGWISDRIGRRCNLLGLCAMIGLISSLLILYIPHLPFSMMFILLFGFGIGAAGQILTFAIVKDNNHSHVIATAIGFNNMAVVAGGALFQPLVGILLRRYWSGEVLKGMPFYGASSYRIALFVVPLCFLIAWIISTFLIKETYCKPKYPL